MSKMILVFSLALGILVPGTLWAEESTGGEEKPAVATVPVEEPKAEELPAEPKAEEPPAEPQAEEPAPPPEVPKVDEPPAVEEPKAEIPDVKSHIEDDDEALTILSQLREAAKGGEWILVVGLGISLILYGARRFNLLSRVPPQFVPVIAAVLGVLWYIVPSLMKGGDGLQGALTSGLLAGLASVGSWETIFKRFLKKAKPAES